MNRPFVFCIEGEFQDVRLHIINGACPVHARMHNKKLPADRRPYEAEPKRIQGTLIGVYATNAVGRLTHPGTSTHPHLIFKDTESGVDLTGHLEKVGIVKGAVLKLPQQYSSVTPTDQRLPDCQRHTDVGGKGVFGGSRLTANNPTCDELSIVVD